YVGAGAAVPSERGREAGAGGDGGAAVTSPRRQHQNVVGGRGAIRTRAVTGMEVLLPGPARLGGVLRVPELLADARVPGRVVEDVVQRVPAGAVGSAVD